MKKPFLQGEEFLAAVRSAHPPRPDHLHIWWLGQSGFLIRSHHGSILLDPYLSDSLTRKYAATDKPHVRITENVIHPAQLDFIDVVTSSHNHTDHLDAETIIPLRSVNPAMQFIIPEANRKFVADRIQCDPDWPIGLNDGKSVHLSGFEITGVPAAHESIDRDDQGQCHYLGYIIRSGQWCIYHSGDTLLYDGQTDLLRPFHIDIALLPINGHRPERRVAGNLNGAQAAHLANDLNARLTIPCHFDLFEFNTESPDLFLNTAHSLNLHTRVLRPGQGISTSEISLKKG